MTNKNVWIFVALAVAIYAGLGIYADLYKLITVVGNFQWIFLFAVFALTVIGYLIRFLKWDFFLKKVGVKLKTQDNLFVFFSGLSMIVTPGKMGEVWKGWLIKDMTGEKLSRTVPVVVADRVTDVLGLIILSSAGILYYKDGLYAVLPVSFLMLLFFASVRSRMVSEKITVFFEKRMGKYAENAKAMHITFSNLMLPRDIIFMSFIASVAWFFECLGLYVVVLGFGKQIDVLLSLFVFSFASLAGALSMVPGGLGVAEGTISGLLQFFGMDAAIAVGVALIVRIGTLWFGAVLGLSVFLMFRKRIYCGHGIKVNKEK